MFLLGVTEGTNNDVLSLFQKAPSGSSLASQSTISVFSEIDVSDDLYTHHLPGVSAEISVHQSEVTPSNVESSASQTEETDFRCVIPN